MKYLALGLISLGFLAGCDHNPFTPTPKPTTHVCHCDKTCCPKDANVCHDCCCKDCPGGPVDNCPCKCPDCK